MGGFFEFFVCLSMDHLKDNFRNNYFIFKPNYLISLLITIFGINFLNNYFSHFLITTFIL
jgi:hypothetical protein